MDEIKISYTVKEAVGATGYSRARLYELLADGKLEARKDGRKTVILAKSIRDYLAGLPQFVSTAARAA